MIDKIIKQLKPLINGKLIYLSQYGSHLYGLNTENSDLDFRGVYIPNLDDIILGRAQDEINTELTVTMFLRQKKLIDHTFEESDYEWTDVKKKVDIKIFSLQKFIQLCSKADTNALDLLFSFPLTCNHVERWQWIEGEIASPIWYMVENKDKLINTDRLESPITYAFKQATKYGLKGERLFYLKYVLEQAKKLSFKPICATQKYHTVRELVNDFLKLDGKHLKIDELDNKGKKELYLNVCGVQHQYNLELDTFIERLEEKINKEYTSQRTKDAADGNDWKALSHAIRVLLEVKQLLEDGTITFPCIENRFLLRIKQGKISREVIDEFFNKQLSNILEKVKLNELGWKYDEQFWNKFILEEYKHVN